MTEFDGSHLRQLGEVGFSARTKSVSLRLNRVIKMLFVLSPRHSLASPQDLVADYQGGRQLSLQVVVALDCEIFLRPRERGIPEPIILAKGGV